VAIGRLEITRNARNPTPCRICIAALLVSWLAAGCRAPDSSDATLNRWPTWSEPMSYIGRLDSPSHEVFGSLTDVAVGPNETIFILDGQSALVSAFDTLARFLWAAGGPGSGPRELANPLSIAVTTKGHAFVGQLTRTWKVFSTDTDAAPQLASLAVSPRDMCAIPAGLVIHGASIEESAILWIYSESGERLKAFGKSPVVDNPILRAELARGRVACSAEANRIVFAPVSVDSTIQAFTLTGDSAWVATIPNYLPMTIRTTPNGGYSALVPETGYHTVAALLPWSPHEFLLQVAYHTSETRAAGIRWSQLRSYTVDPASGLITAIDSDLPELIAVGQRIAVGVEEAPYPRLIIWRRALE
jgi:hypothetical protein